MTKLPFALSTAFILSACSGSVTQQVIRECDGPAGHTEMVKSRWGGNEFTLVHDGKDGSHHEYKFTKGGPWADNELVLGESAVETACATGAPDARWKELAP